jgi:hypothetical protein
MAKIGHTATFNSKKHEATVSEMRSRRESVHEKGAEVLRTTGKMDKLVSVRNGEVRKSQFAFTKQEDGTFLLAKGPKVPFMFATDGTGSFGENVGHAFHAAPKVYNMLEQNARGVFHMDFSFSVFQDRDDRYDCIQVPEFESDNKFAEHMRLLLPANSGGDQDEDYDYGIWYAANRVEATLFRYGGKGLFTLLLDACGRGTVEPRMVQHLLGGTAPQSSVSTKQVWQNLSQKFHPFVVIYNSIGGSDSWWRNICGRDHVVIAPRTDLFDEIQAGLWYMVNTLQPTEEGLGLFLNAGGQNPQSASDVRAIWKAYIDAGVPFGANVKMGIELPKVGDTFASMDDMWPIGHAKAGMKLPALPAGSAAPSLPSGDGSALKADAPKSKGINWGKKW